MNIVKQTAAAFRTRAVALGLKGKRRDEALLDYWSGATTTCLLLGRTDEAQYLNTVGSMILQVRGYSEIESLCALPDETKAMMAGRVG